MRIAVLEAISRMKRRDRFLGKDINTLLRLFLAPASPIWPAHNMQGGDAEDPAAADRRRRLGALCCSMMSLLALLALLSTDPGPGSASSQSGSGLRPYRPFAGPAPSPEPEAALSRQVATLGSGGFPTNVTAVFKGKWSSQSGPSARLRDFGGDAIQ